MRVPRQWKRLFRLRRWDPEADVDAELRFHFDERTSELVGQGVALDAARGQAAKEFGDTEAVRTALIAIDRRLATRGRRAEWWESVAQDLGYALRSLRRAPGWTVVAVLTMALGVGATTTMFSVADALLVRPIPYRDAARVFVLHRELDLRGGHGFVGIPIAAVREWFSNTHTIEGIAPFGRSSSPLGIGRDTITVNAALVDTGFFAFAGAHPLIGRTFTADEFLANGPGAVMLAEDFWRRQYGGSPDVIGKVVQFGERLRTIVGVAPASLIVPDFSHERADVWLPLSPSIQGVVSAAVRLKPGVSPKAATDEITAMFKQLPDDRIVGASWRWRLTRPQDSLPFRQALVVLIGAVVLLLLVACTNVTHLMLARGAARQRELAVRHALGAGRMRLLRQLLTEAVVLAMIGGGFAVFVGWAGLHLLAAARPPSLVALSYVSTNRGIVTIAATLAIVAGLAIGLISALRGTHHDLAESLRTGPSSTPMTGRGLRAVLVIGEVALSATLLVGALLLFHAVFDLQRTPLGFDARGLYAISFPTRGSETPESRAAFAAQLRERSAGIPGEERVTVASGALRSFQALASYETPEHQPESGEAPGGNAVNFVQPDYFSMMGMRLLAGRTFDAGSAVRGEVIVSRSLANEIWPDGVAVGRRFRNAILNPDGSHKPWQTVIGVVPDVVQDLVQGGGQPELYQSLNGDYSGGITLVVRLAAKDPAPLLSAFVTVVQPEHTKPVIEDVQQQIDRSLAEPRFTMLIVVAFAALGVVLAAIGIFGVISYSVAQRTQEIGVRMTLGATRGTIARLVVGDGLRLATIGIALGLVGASAGTRLIQNMLYGVSRFDPFSFGVGATVLLAVAVVACVIPMVRTTGVDPATAVRAE